MKSRGLITIIVVAAALLGLFLYPRFTDSNRPRVAQWHAAGVLCLENEQNLALHIHPLLTISVDGAAEPIPADTGNVRSCTAELHMHDTTGAIHVESNRGSATFTLGQFFAVYGKPIERPGYALAMTVDGAASAELGNLVLRDEQEIAFTYTKL